MADSAETIKAFVKKTINLKVTGTTVLIEARAGKKFFVKSVTLSRSAFAGGSGTNAGFSVGSDSATGYTDVLDGDGGAKLSFSAIGGGANVGVDGIDQHVPHYGYAKLVDINTLPIRFNVQSASTWATDTATVIIEGYYI